MNKKEKDLKLVVIKGKNALTNSLIVSQGLKVEHNSTKKLIKKYIDRFKNKGNLWISNLEINDRKETRGRKEEVYWLNETQTIFLISLSKNTDEVVDFKDRLSDAFTKQKQLLLEKQTLEYKQIRAESKLHHREQTDILKLSIPNIKQSEYIKACTISKKAVANKYGLKNMIAKEEMTNEQLKTYTMALNLTTAFIVAKYKGADIDHISNEVYNTIGYKEVVKIGG